MLRDIFFLPVLDNVLLHAPLHGVSALLNPSGAEILKHALISRNDSGLPAAFHDLFVVLSREIKPPQPRSGNLGKPRFLGLLPTRGCSMLCRYCDFPVSPQDSRQVMPYEVCQQAIDAYLNLLQVQGIQHGAIHFFGGEPFFAPELVFFAVEYARYRARQAVIDLHLEATTNGLLEQPLLSWVAENFDSIVLSFDGAADVQNFHRPVYGLQESYTQVSNTAKTFAESQCELILRSCITQGSLPDVVDTVMLMAERYHPSAICLEPLSESERSRRFGLQPPDPWKFARIFIRVEQAMKLFGIQCVLSTADLSLRTVSSCPVGHDALIVSPDGEVDACYLVKDAWLHKGMDMQLGDLQNGKFELAPVAIKRVRGYELGHKSLCDGCFCRYHCAGGCHVNHDCGGRTAAYDDLCIRTRIVSLARLLMRIGQTSFMEEWLADDDACRRSALWGNDRMEGWK